MTSIIKDDVYLDFNGSLVLRKESRRLDNLSVSYTLSYSFELSLTTKNLQAFGISSIDQSDKQIYRSFNVKIKTSNIIINGKLRVESITDKINCSFFTDNYDVFSLFNGTIRDIRFSEYTFTFPALGTNNEGYIHIPINNGTNRLTWNVSSDYNYIPCFHVSSILKDMLQEEGIKLEGDILNEWRYQHLVLGNNSVFIEYDPDYIFDRTVFAGKTASQSVTGINKITFPNETGVFYDNPGWWDGLDDYQTSTSQNIAFELNVQTDTVGAHTLTVVGSVGGTLFTYVFGAGESSAFKTGFSQMLSTETISAFITPSSGTINVLSGSTFKLYPFTTFDNNGSTVRSGRVETLPRFIMPPINKSNFLKSILSLFNPIIDFNPLTKTLTVNLFENIKNNPEEDWSNYIVSYEIDFEETLQSYAKKSMLLWKDSDDEEIVNYNNSSQIPFGGGALNIDNDFLQPEETVLEMDFVATWMQQNTAQQAYFPVFPFFPDEDPLDYRLFLAKSFPVTSFSSKSTIDTESTLGYGWFVKQNIGKSIDDIKVNLSFENPIGYQGAALKDDYFKVTEDTLNDPVKITAIMNIPENIYRNFNSNIPKRIKTSTFNSLFFCLAIEGWEESNLPCEVELIKL